MFDHYFEKHKGKYKDILLDLLLNLWKTAVKSQETLENSSLKEAEHIANVAVRRLSEYCH